MSDTAIQTIGTILSCNTENHYMVMLMNGKIVHGHLAKACTELNFTPETRVLLELTPFDFDQARICGRAENE